MLREIRRTTTSVRTVALAMLLCMVSASVSALLHSEDDDVLCGVVVEHHDHTAHRIGGATAPTPQGDHCFICHNQSLRSLVATGVSSSAPHTEAEVEADHSPSTGVECPRRHSARAPPFA